MRNSMNTLIANMAVADLLMTIDIPYVVKWLFVYDKWFGTFAGSALCKFFHSAQSASVACSVFSLVAISFDRSFAILFPLRTIFTRNVVRLCIALTWLGALAFAVPLMIATTVVSKGDDHLCNEWAWGQKLSARVYASTLFTLTYVVPLILIALTYTLTGLRLWSRKLPGHRNLLSNAHKKARATGKRATVMLITVVVVFALFWMPFQVREMILQYESMAVKLPKEILILSPFIGYSNSAINPILYVIFSENFRREFKRILWHRVSTREHSRNSVIRKSSCTRMTRLSRDHSALPLYKRRESANTGRLSGDGDHVLGTEMV